jgi:hypothetical protein
MFAEPMEGGYEVVVKVQERFDPSIISHIQNNR